MVGVFGLRSIMRLWQLRHGHPNWKRKCSGLQQKLCKYTSTVVQSSASESLQDTFTPQTPESLRTPEKNPVLSRAPPSKAWKQHSPVNRTLEQYSVTTTDEWACQGLAKGLARYTTNLFPAAKIRTCSPSFRTLTNRL